MRVQKLSQLVDLENANYYGVDNGIAEKYIATLTDHITYVIEAGRNIGVPMDQLWIHDDSKWTADEFPGYALHFQGGGAPDAFASAWLHHIHHNPHHWNYWLFADGYSPKGSQVESGAVEMPEKYALEMIADWMGAGRAYTGSWDMTDWLLENIPRIRLHSKTALYVMSMLDKFGYQEIPLMVKFKGGGK